MRINVTIMELMKKDLYALADDVHRHLIKSRITEQEHAIVLRSEEGDGTDLKEITIPPDQGVNLLEQIRGVINDLGEEVERILCRLIAEGFKAE